MNASTFHQFCRLMGERPGDWPGAVIGCLNEFNMPVEINAHGLRGTVRIRRARWSLATPSFSVRASGTRSLSARGFRPARWPRGDRRRF